MNNYSIIQIVVVIIIKFNNIAANLIHVICVLLAGPLLVGWKVVTILGAPTAQGAPQNPGIILYRPMFCE